MKFNFIVPIILAVLLGYICASFILIKYSDNNENLEKTTVYFLQVGAYKDLNNIKGDLNNIKNKIIINKDNWYYTYIGITYSKENALKIKKIYKENNIETYIKKKNIDNKNFLLELEQYDILLTNSKTKEEIDSVLKTILATYEEDVLNT